jgi:hypothetical protein
MLRRIKLVLVLPKGPKDVRYDLAREYETGCC